MKNAKLSTRGRFAVVTGIVIARLAMPTCCNVVAAESGWHAPAIDFTNHPARSNDDSANERAKDDNNNAEQTSVPRSVARIVNQTGSEEAIPIEIRAEPDWAPAVLKAELRVIQVQATQPAPAPAPAAPAPPATAPVSPPAAPQAIPLIVELNPFSRSIAGNQPLKGTTTDAGSLLIHEPGNAVEPRSPIENAPILLGRRLGQLAADGSYWFPARLDLDTMLSKIDSDLVDDIIVIKGPYSALYGPGFAFYDVELADAPRYAGGYQTHGRTTLDYQTNGEQWHGRTAYWGGSTDWGFRIGYGHRTGSDYETGAGFELPTSYNSRNPDVALGVDLSENHRVDFRYLRLDQTDVELPGQFYDIDFLVTNGYELKYVWDHGGILDHVQVEGWYNRTRFFGDDLSPGKRRQIPFLDIFDIDSFTNVAASSAGYRVATVWGDAELAQLTFGSDLRFLKQRLVETTTIFQTPEPDTIIPPAQSSNPGLFLEGFLNLTDRLRLRAGGRADWVSTTAEKFADLDNNGFPVDLEFILRGPFDRQYNLQLAYLTAEYELDRHWTATGGFGYATRPPTMTELYAVDPFIAVLPQLVFTSVRGNPDLDVPRMKQLDVGLQTDYGWYRSGVSGFYSWVADYITLELLFSNPLTTRPIYSFVNTDRATLSGGEIYGECDVTDRCTAFARMSYVEGRDHTRNLNTAPTSPNPPDMRSNVSTPEEPLPVIPPLASSIGFRLHEPCPSPSWAVEFNAIVVDAQDRVATSLLEQPTAGFTTYDILGYWQAYDDLRLTAGVRNLSDRFYQTHFDTVYVPQAIRPVFQPGRNFYFGFELTY